MKRWKDCHRSEKLDNYIGCYVRVYLIDGDIKEGWLHYTSEYNHKDPNMIPYHYSVDNCHFRKSHVKKIEHIKKGGNNEY